MTSHRLQSTPITGYYEYLSRIRQRVNVAPYEGVDSEETMTQTTTDTSSPIASVMDNDNTVSAANSTSVDNLQEPSFNLNDKDVTTWSSAEVQHWVEEQCQKFELKKATTEKFQLNGQALVLLTKHDFLRRSPDGGEILYYALQRLINPNKITSGRTNQNVMGTSSWRQSARIVEVGSDTDEHDSTRGSSPSTKPIVEEPDDPPLHRRLDSDTTHENHQRQYYPHSFFHNHLHAHQPVFTMPAAAYYHQQQVFPNTFAYAHHPHHHAHPHMPQQQFVRPHPHPHLQFIHQYYPMMSAQGILIELIDDEEAQNLTANGGGESQNGSATNGASSDAHEQLYLLTVNGQRYVMNEQQVIQYVAQIQQQQQQQQQQHFQQHQHFHQQQQQQQFHQQQPQPQHTPQQHQTSQDNIFHTT